MKKKIVVLCPGLPGRYRDIINDTAVNYGFIVSFCDDSETALREAADAEILYGQSAEFIRAGKKARWICAMSAGVEEYLKPGVIANPDCLLTNSSGSYGVSIAEHLVMVTVMILRGQKTFMREMDQKIWNPDRRMRSIKNSVITVAGTGDIGRNYAQRIRAFEPKEIIGINRSGRNPGKMFDRIDTASNTDRYLDITDVLVLCLPETKETRGFMSKDRLEHLSPEAYVINVGRGSTLDQKALTQRLSEKKLAGAALDVMETEPVPDDDPLWNLDPCILTPHISGKMTLDCTIDKNVRMFCEDLVNYCQGKRLRYLVDKNRGY